MGDREEKEQLQMAAKTLTEWNGLEEDIQQLSEQLAKMYNSFKKEKGNHKISDKTVHNSRYHSEFWIRLTHNNPNSRSLSYFVNKSTKWFDLKGFPGDKSKLHRAVRR